MCGSKGRAVEELPAAALVFSEKNVEPISHHHTIKRCVCLYINKTYKARGLTTNNDLQ